MPYNFHVSNYAKIGFTPFDNIFMRASNYLARMRSDRMFNTSFQVNKLTTVRH